MDFQPLFNIFTSKPVIRQREENIQAMMEEIDKACVFPQDEQKRLENYLLTCSISEKLDPMILRILLIITC